MSSPAMAGRSFEKTWYMQSAAAETGRYRLQGIEINLENGTIVERWKHWSPAEQGNVPAMKTVKTVKAVKAMKALKTKKTMKHVVPKMASKKKRSTVSEMAASSSAKKSQKGAKAKTTSKKGTAKKKAAS